VIARWISEAYYWSAGVWMSWKAPPWLLDAIWMLLAAAFVAIFISLSALYLIWMERKVSGHIQSRLGPMRVGWHGAAQVFADMIKILLKEDITPAKADKWVFNIAPFAIMIPAIMSFMVIPFGDRLIIADINVGILYIIALGSFVVLAMIMAGWASNNKWSLLGAMRSAAVLFSYELPLILVIVAVVMLNGSMQVGRIIAAQTNTWNIFLMPVGFLLYLFTGVAEINRTPFDLAEAEQELVAGYNVEYSGMKFGMFFFSEFVNNVIVAAMITILFLGGPLPPFGINIPFLPSPVWMWGKVLILIFIFMWIKWTLPRFRIDQMLDVGWKVLLPLAFLNLFITGGIALLI